jgi:hypothetical protein
MNYEKEKRRVWVESRGVLFFSAFPSQPNKVEILGENAKGKPGARILRDFSNLVQSYVTLHK